MEKRIKMSGKWNGWYYYIDEEVIYDNDGNHYYLNEIRSLFYLRHWFGSNESDLDKSKIRWLRDELQKKINEVKRPTVTIDWGDVQEKYIHPHYRR